jgi:hypothetical protein
MDIALMAINYMIYVNNKQPFIEAVRAVHKLAGRNYDVKAACLDFLGSLALVPNTADYEEYVCSIYLLAFLNNIQ